VTLSIRYTLREHNLGNNLVLCEEHLTLSILTQRQGCRTPHCEASRCPRLLALCIDSRHGYFFFYGCESAASLNWLDNYKLIMVPLLPESRLWWQMLVYTDFCFPEQGSGPEQLKDSTMYQHILHIQLVECSFNYFEHLDKNKWAFFVFSGKSSGTSNEILHSTRLLSHRRTSEPHLHLCLSSSFPIFQSDSYATRAIELEHKSDSPSIKGCRY
jgi:hypothetical protein